MRGIVMKGGLVVVTAFTLVFLGCEDDPDTENVGQALDSVDFELEDMPATNPGLLTIQPANAGDDNTLNTNGELLRLRADRAGGTEARITWSVRDSGSGRFINRTQRTAVYERLSAGDNVVIAQDAEGAKAYYIVIQP